MRSLAVLLFLLLYGSVAAAAPQKITIKEDKRGYSSEIAYPRFGHAAIDRQLEAWARAIAADFREAARESTGQPNPWSAEVDYDIVRNDAQMTVVGFRYYSYLGGAHPNTTTETFNFLMPEGRRVEFGEVFSQRGVQRVSDISIASLKRDLSGADGPPDLDWIKRGAGPNARNFSSFALTPTALNITFDAYVVAAYVFGPQEVRIPLSQLRDVMRPNPRAPAASFECANARTDVERMICTSNELATLDRHMGEAYHNKLAWEFEPAKQAALRAQQRAWLRARDTNCQGSGAAVCLTAMYQRRLKELETP